MNIVKSNDTDIKVVGTDEEYRRIPRDSYSTLKELSASPLSYYKKYIERSVKYTPSEDAIRGSITDCLLFTPDQFEDRFIVSGVTPPSKLTNMGKFVEQLVKLTEQYSDNGVLKAEFGDLCALAYKNVKYDFNGTEVAFKRESLEDVIKKFEGSDDERYYQEQRAALTKTVISSGILSNAQSLKSTLLSHRNTDWLFNNKHTKLAQLQILVEIDGLPIKVMLDYVIIDHFSKTIYPYDLKVTWEVLNFQRNYLVNKYYLQAGLYQSAVGIWAEKEYPNYRVAPFQFILCHSPNQLAPSIIKLGDRDIEKAWYGFFSKGYYYPGIKELIEDVKWHKENNVYNERRVNYLKRGITELIVSYD